jgi:hypothetical protein
MSLKAIDQFPFALYGDTFTVALANDHKLYVAIEAICDARECTNRRCSASSARRPSPGRPVIAGVQ